MSRFPVLSSLPRTRHSAGSALIALLAGFVVSGTLAAQESLQFPRGHEDQRVDHVIAIVGDSIILWTDLEEDLIRLRAEGVDVPESGEVRDRIARERVDALVNQQLLLQAALRDTLVTVSDERIESALRAAWEDEIRRWGTESALREELERSQGLTVAQYRQQRRDEIRRYLLIESYLQLRRREARREVVSDAEVEAFFNEQRAQLSHRPASISFEQAIVPPTPGDSAMSAARDRIDELMARIRADEDFEALARQYSEDTGSRQQGGDIGWYRRGDNLDRDFEDAAFGLREGGMTGPVETMFGAHVIRVDRVRGAERRISHILISAAVLPEDVERARMRAVEIGDRLREGAPIREFTEEQRRLDIQDSAEIPMEYLNELPDSFASALRGASEGETVGPVEFPLGGQQPAWAVFRITRIREAGEFTLDDIRSQVRQHLQQQKMEERLLRDLRARMHVDIRI